MSDHIIELIIENVRKHQCLFDSADEQYKNVFKKAELWDAIAKDMNMTSMNLKEFTETLIMLSEKAANISRICRKDEHLLKLLVEEKKDDEKNPRFVHDFKTLADVLVQQVVIHEISLKFPSMRNFIYGEECNKFTSDKESITVEIKDNEIETMKLLKRVLNDEKAASVLAKEVHKDTKYECSLVNLNGDDLDLLIEDDLAIWIDPIDSTAEYIHGKNEYLGEVAKSGLQCVTVLIGVYKRITGVPIIGVVNQPFHNLLDDSLSWTGFYVLGISINNIQLQKCSKQLLNESKKIIAVSSNEKKKLKEDLMKNNFEIIEIAGAGYKLLNVITGYVCAYLLTKPTTFFWDICACDAILRSMGGGVLELKTMKPIKYKSGIGVKECCNENGIFAYRNELDRDKIVGILNNCNLFE